MLLITKIALFLSFIVLGAYSTTDIIRLSSFGTSSINDGDCFCPVCLHKLRLRDQIPTLSYILNNGKCHFCGSSIPKSDFFLEIIIYLGCILISLLTGFSTLSFILTIIYYESVKLIYVIKFRKRKDRFLTNLCLSILINLIMFTLIFFIFMMINIVSEYS